MWLAPALLPTFAATAERPLLTGAWRNLILASYAVPDELVRPHLPEGVELDRRDGKAFVSVVTFQFDNAKVRGLACPGARSFPEWNLRTYVRRGTERGVCFLREYAPPRLVAWTARLVYGEPFYSAPVTARIDDTPDSLAASYTIERGGRSHTLTAEGTKPAARTTPGTAAHFFLHQHLAFGSDRRGRVVRSEVRRPHWPACEVKRFHADLDWAALYGSEWAVMNGRSPESVLLTAGSAVAASAPRAI